MKLLQTLALLLAMGALLDGARAADAPGSSNAAPPAPAVTAATPAHANTPATATQVITAAPPAPAASAAPSVPATASRAVMTGEQVVRILDETVDWYRTLGAQQQTATQPSDLLILYANRQIADRAIALAFELARANAELLSSEADLAQKAAAAAASSTLAMRQVQLQLDGKRTELQAEIVSTQRRLAAAPKAQEAELQARLAELQSELDLVNARRNLHGSDIAIHLSERCERHWRKRAEGAHRCHSGIRSRPRGSGAGRGWGPQRVAHVGIGIRAQRLQNPLSSVER